jgi:flagellar basal body-associated protein FliL
MQAKTKTLWLIMVVFLLGGIAGGFVGSTYFGKKNAFHSRPSREEIQKEFATKLKLTPEQSATIDSVFEANRAKMNIISKQYSQLFKAHRDSLRAEIRKQLTPEQNKLYDDFIKEIDEREKRWRHGSR